ncbi:T9SS type B sorting domain-containing protein [Muricauda sp. JGD-17]|uniref:T9SS type B sorting domain-containing protein n=1 Tax=Flagellimonas ochracea TaxID=2696472 RepID=A0A964TCN7_9FLAO|nr:gliding motility-associated C-terminal domain-containing protein [Allomuricauda ochracea]NAY91066.1 T9SS type B sorting domain-containing protein [Allomuricauda ochracea]
MNPHLSQLTDQTETIMRFSYPSLKWNVKFRIGIFLLVSILIVIPLLGFTTLNKRAYFVTPKGHIPESLNHALAKDAYAPAIAILKEGNASADCATIQYTFSVSNQSTNAEVLENVVITDVDLGGIIAVPFTGDDILNGVLDPGETWVYNVTYNITFQDLVDGQVGENPANVVADVQGQMAQVNDVSHPTDILDDGPTIVDLAFCQTASIGLQKAAIPQDLDNDGCLESILYQFRATNLGTISLYDVVLTDPLIIDGEIPGPKLNTDIGEDGILSPSESWFYDILYVIDPLDVVGGEIINQGNITSKRMDTDEEVSDDSDPVNFVDDNPTETPVDEICDSGQSDIGLVKTGTLTDLNGDGCPESIQYLFEVSNIGDLDLDSVNIVDEKLEEGAISGPLAGTDVNDDGVLSVGETWSFEATYAITPEDLLDVEVVNQAVVSAEPVNFDFLVLDDSHDEDRTLDGPTTTNIEGACVPGIGLIKTGTAIDFDADGCRETIQYTFEVANTGTEDLGQVVLSDILFGQFGEDIEGPMPGSDINNDEILSVNEVWTYEVFYPIAQADIDLGSVINQASVNATILSTNSPISDDSHPDSLYEDGQTDVNVGGACPAESRIGLIKAAPGGLLDLDGDACPETIRYEFTVANTGSIVLDQIQLTDVMLGGEVTGLDTSTDDNNDGLLFPNETWIYEAFYPIKQMDIDAGSVTNQAQVTALEQISNLPIMDDSDDDSFDQNDETITSTAGACVAQANIGLIKSAPPGSFEDLDNDGCPENIRYTFTIRNIGAIPLEQIELTDMLLGAGPIDGPLPGNDINGDGILSPNETWTYQALYPITEQNITDTSVTNQANVTAMEQGTANAISDASDDNSFDENDETITSVIGACAAEAKIAITKNATPIDSDDDGCPETILYTFTVNNTGAIDLYQVTISDNLLQEPINGPLNGTDVGDDNILSTTETWVFEATYTITESDFDVGLVVNQAAVSALEVPTDSPIEDESNEITTSFGDLCEEPIEPVDPTDPNFEIFNGISPNEDGVNDFFEIRGIENYPDNQLQVFNRWGVLVFEAESYGLDNRFFTGQSEGSATVAEERKLPTGTYFYTLRFTGNNPGKEVYTGYLYINND